MLINWWLIVFLCFLPLALICKQQFDYRVLLNNLFLIDNTWCPFADYLLFYVTAVITYPFIYWMLNKVNKPLFFYLGTFLVGMILRKGVERIVPQGFLYQVIYFYLLYIVFLVAGSCVYQSSAFFKIHKWLSGKRWNKMWFKVTLVFVLIPVRWLTGNKLALDPFLATIMVFLIIELLQGKEQSLFFRGMHFLGKHSTNIWFLHAIFFFSFAEYTQWIIYFPRVTVAIVFSCIVCCLPFSWVINLLYNKIICFIFKRNANV